MLFHRFLPLQAKKRHAVLSSHDALYSIMIAHSSQYTGLILPILRPLNHPFYPKMNNPEKFAYRIMNADDAGTEHHNIVQPRHWLRCHSPHHQTFHGQKDQQATYPFIIDHYSPSYKILYPIPYHPGITLRDDKESPFQIHKIK